MKERECSQGFKGGDFRPKGENTTRPLTERSDTLFVRGEAKGFPSCHTASVGVRGLAPVNGSRG